MKTVAIVGTGLLGSSFGLAVKKTQRYDRILGVSSPAVVAKAIEIGAIDEALSFEDAIPQADLILLAQPVLRILTTIEKLDALLKPGAIVTDVGSTKSTICAAAAKSIHRGHFVGGHPMAGREVRGPDGASADLFIGRPWVLTEALPELIELVEALGGRPVVLGPEEHDRLVSWSSHLPQLLSTTLAALLEGRGVDPVAGPGVLDMTRLALSSHELWEDILSTNAANVDDTLAQVIAELERTRAAIRSGEVRALFARGNQGALALRH